MSEPIREQLKLEGVDQVVAGLQATARAEQQLAGETKKAGEAAGDASKHHGAAADAAINYGRWIAAQLAGIASFTALVQANTQAMQENAAATNRLKEAQLDLQFLSQGLRFDELAAVKGAAEIKGGPDALIDATKAFAQLKSQTATLSDANRIKLFEQMTETSLTTAAPLSALTGLFAKGSQFVSDPERLQSLIRKAQELSPVDRPEALASLLPRALGTGGEVGLTAEQSTGLLVSAMLVDKEKGETSLRNILTILGGDQTPEQQQILEGAGAPRSVGIMAQLARLRDAKLDAAQKSALVGRENFTVFSGLLSQNQFESNVAAMFKATTGGRDLTQEAIANIYGGDVQQRLRLQTAQAEARVESIKSSDEEAQRVALARVLMEESLRKAGLSPARVMTNLKTFDLLTSVGVSPESLLENSLPKGIESPSLDRPIDLDVGAIGREYRTTPTGATTIIHGNVYNQGNPALRDSDQRRQP